MYHGKYEAKHLQHKRKHRKNNRPGILLFSLLALVTTMVGGTLAYLVTGTEPVTNTFEPSFVDCEVSEDFDGSQKSHVNVTNTGDTDAYVRVKLVAYRANDEGQHIGGIAEIPAFNPGAGWVKNGDHYYYIKPVAPGQKPAEDFIDSITLSGSYTDADGGRQVIEVMAEAIQANGVADNGTKAVVEAWGVDPEKLGQGGAGK